jgi:hypothetical protein
LLLDSNQLSGAIPSELGNIKSLLIFSLSSNQLSGLIPDSLLNLTNLVVDGLDIRWNGLSTSNVNLDNFLDSKQNNGNWSQTQTIAPTNLQITALSQDSVSLSWDAIEYSDDPGGFRVWYRTSSMGSLVDAGITENKSVTSITINELMSSAEYFFEIRTETQSHASNNNHLESDSSNIASSDDYDMLFGNGFEPITNKAIFGPLTGAKIIAYRLNNVSIPVEITTTEATVKFYQAGGFKLLLDGISDEEWILVSATSGLNIDVDDDGIQDLKSTVNFGTIHALSQAKYWRNGGQNISVITDLSWKHLLTTIENFESNTIKNNLDDFSKIIFSDDVNGDKKINWQDINQFISNRSQHQKKLSFDYQRLLDSNKYENSLINSIHENDVYLIEDIYLDFINELTN